MIASERVLAVGKNKSCEMLTIADFDYESAFPALLLHSLPVFAKK
jgi:hypothetical protein